MVREYKKVLPIDTIKTIRDIFTKLKLSIFEDYWTNISDKIFSCTINLEGFNALASHGKGRSHIYALASAYAEIMERIQNLKLFFMKIGIPDQEILSLFSDTKNFNNLSELYNANKDICRENISHLCEKLKIPSRSPVFSAEFYDICNDSVVYLPYLYMLDSSGSNGMCAGNEPYEAIVQGICEILERESLKQIFNGNVIPPDIPNSYFKNSLFYDRIELMDKYNISVIVKDCSLGKKFPIIGVLMINRKTGRYRFKLGAHPVFDYALERAINEIYQGIDEKNIDTFGEEFNLSDNIIDKEPDKLSQKEKNFILTTNFVAQLRTGSKNIPCSIFLGKPTYSFQEWNSFSKSYSYKEDLFYLIDIIRQNNLNIYIRDVSFLGFPSYYIFIPEYSSVFSHWPWEFKSRKQKIEECYQNKVSDKTFKEIYKNLNTASKNEISDFINYLKEHISSIETDDRDKHLWLEMIYHYDVPDNFLVIPEYLLALLYYKIEDYENAYVSMNSLLTKYKFDRSKFEYFFILKDIFYFMSHKQQLKNIKNIILDIYSENKIDKVIHDLSNKNTFFQNIPVPDYSRYEYSEKLDEIFNIIKKEAGNNKIDQSGLKLLFRK